MAILYSGTEGTCAWTIDDQGHLYIGDGVISHSTDISTDWGWYSYRTNIIDVTSGQISWALNANTCNMFNGCINLVSFDASNFDTSNVTDMYAMFWNCNSLTSLDLSNFDTRKVTDMSRMFNSCYALASIDLSSFDTSNVTDMNNMFFYCRSLTTLNLSNLNMSNVTNMRYMFDGCSSLISLNLSNISINNVTDMYYMFAGCSALTSLNLSSFNTSKVENMTSMFERCSSLTSLDLSSFDTSEVKNMKNMFDNCSSLTSIDLSSFDTSKVQDMCGMFGNCSSLTSLDLSDFNTSQVEDMCSMFSGCSSLTSLDLSDFDTSSVEDMSHMFDNCSSLTSLDLSNFNTNQVQEMTYMFYECSSLSSLDISSFNTINVDEMDYMFSKCTALTGNIYVMGRPSSYSGIFTDTTQPIYIIQNTSSPNSQTTSYWKSRANTYSNVHYEATDHINYPSTITGEVSRVDDDGNLSNEGTKAKIELRTTQSDQFVPQNVVGPAASRFTNTLTITITMDENNPISGNNGSNIINLTTLPFGAHTFVCTVTDINTSSSITLTLSQARALLDFLGKGCQGGYIDKPGMGMAIGKFASRNGLDIQFPTVIGEGLSPATQPVDPIITNDSTVNLNKIYYTYDSITDKYYLIEEPNTEINPQNEGWYEAENQAVDLNNYQLIIGKYNKQNDDATFIIGNGDDDNNRSNLMVVGDNYIRIGNTYDSHLELDYHSLQMIDKEGNPFLNVKDLRNKEGEAEITVTFVSDGMAKAYSLIPNAKDTNYSVIVNNVEITNFYQKTTSSFVLATEPADGTLITVTYITTEPGARAFTFGSRNSNGTIGISSAIFGNECIASGTYAFALGNSNTARGKDSVAGGLRAIANGSESFSFGLDTITNADNSCAMGYSNTTNSNAVCSFAFGGELTTKYPFQTVIGRRNQCKAQDLFEVGNGWWSGELESNALELTYNGKLTIASTLYQNSDQRLKKHISYLSNEAIDFIEELKPVYYIKDKEKHLGFYAQDVEKIDKWNCMVSEMNGYKTLGYIEIIAPLVTYCQHLEKEIQQLKKEIQEFNK